MHAPQAGAAMTRFEAFVLGFLAGVIYMAVLLWGTPG